MIRLGACLLVVLATACTHFRDRRIAEGVRAVLDRFDPHRSVTIVVRTAEEIPRVRELAGNERPIAVAAQFFEKHRDGEIPGNILFTSARLQGEAVHIRILVPGVSHPPPPTVMACGTDFLIEATRPNRQWILRYLEAGVC